jgi:hypothetical protein
MTARRFVALCVAGPSDGVVVDATGCCSIILQSGCSSWKGGVALGCTRGCVLSLCLLRLLSLSNPTGVSLVRGARTWQSTGGGFILPILWTCHLVSEAPSVQLGALCSRVGCSSGPMGTATVVRWLLSGLAMGAIAHTGGSRIRPFVGAACSSSTLGIDND